MSPRFLNHLLQQLPYQLPLLGVYVIGLTLAIVRQRRHPRASMFMAIGCGLLMVVDIGSTLLQAWLFSEMSANRVSGSGFGQTMAMIRPILIAGRTTGAAFIVTAGFPVGPPALPPRVQ